MTQLTTQTRGANTKHGQGKTIDLHFTVILGATLHKEGIGKDARDLTRMRLVSDKKPKTRWLSLDDNKERLVFWQPWPDINTITDTPSIEKQALSNRNELQTKNKRNSTHPNQTEQTWIQEQEMNFKNFHRLCMKRRLHYHH